MLKYSHKQTTTHFKEKRYNTMKQTTNMSRVIGQLQSIGRKINADWFNNELDMERVVWTVQSTPRAYGHFTPYISYRVHDVTGEKDAVEINIGAGTLDRDIIEVICTMIHEMTHYCNWSHNVKDCSRQNTYHSKKFKNEAEKHGLVIEYDSRIGWSITSATEELVNWIIENDFEDFRLGRIEYNVYTTIGGTSTGSSGTSVTVPKKKKSNSIKMICPCCGNIARVTKTTNLICGDCMEHMIEA
jgi:hypothetical protein